MNNYINNKGFISTQSGSNPSITIIETDTYVVEGKQLYLNGINVEEAIISGGGTPGGNNNEIQYNNAGVFGGVGSLKFTSGLLEATGSFSGNFYGEFVGISSASYSVSSSFSETALTASSLLNDTKLVSRLTFDPSVSFSTKTVFNNWYDLWNTYQTTEGAVDIFFCNGTSIGDGQIYVFRSGTSFSGPVSGYEAQVILNLQNDTVFINALHFDSISIENNNENLPCFVYTKQNPTVYLTNGSTFRGNGNVPMILWTEITSSSFINIVLDERSGFKKISSHVLEINGADAASVAGGNTRMGNKTFMESDTLRGNINSTFYPDILAPTAQFSPDQPLYFGENSEQFTSELSIGVSLPNTIQVQGMQLASPTGNGVPNLLFLGTSVTTTDDTPTNAFPTQVPPPVISAIVDLLILAREGATGDSAAWKLTGLVRFTGGGAFVGPLGLQTIFHDASPGASSWDFQLVLNSPTTGQISLNVIGESGKTINWSIGIIETIVLAF